MIEFACRFIPYLGEMRQIMRRSLGVGKPAHCTGHRKDFQNASQETWARQTRPISNRLREVSTASSQRLSRRVSISHNQTALASASPISKSMAKSALVRWSAPERRLTHQRFPKSRLKKLGLRCNCDLGAPDPTFGTLVGADCARPSIRVGTDNCNWC